MDASHEKGSSLSSPFLPSPLLIGTIKGGREGRLQKEEEEEEEVKH